MLLTSLSKLTLVIATYTVLEHHWEAIIPGVLDL